MSPHELVTVYVWRQAANSISKSKYLFIMSSSKIRLLWVNCDPGLTRVLSGITQSTDLFISTDIYCNWCPWFFLCCFKMATPLACMTAWPLRCQTCCLVDTAASLGLLQASANVACAPKNNERYERPFKMYDWLLVGLTFELFRQTSLRINKSTANEKTLSKLESQAALSSVCVRSYCILSPWRDRRREQCVVCGV